MAENNKKIILEVSSIWLEETQDNDEKRCEYDFSEISNETIINHEGIEIKILDKNDDEIKFEILTESLRIFDNKNAGWEISPKIIKLKLGEAITCETISKDGGFSYLISFAE